MLPFQLVCGVTFLFPSDGGIDETPAKPAPQQLDKPASAAERPRPNMHNRPAKTVSIRPFQGLLVASPPLGDQPFASEQDPDESESDIEMPADGLEPDELDGPNTARKVIAEAPDTQSEDDPAPGNDSQASVEPKPEDELNRNRNLSQSQSPRLESRLA
ncbi:hypothetical protein FRC06_007836 [Ceratobasidium sp. 370]|nr:hypothetical protein FRC06_007836 [Ceratobasidium sp. 370]